MATQISGIGENYRRQIARLWPEVSGGGFSIVRKTITHQFQSCHSTNSLGEEVRSLNGVRIRYEGQNLS